MPKTTATDYLNQRINFGGKIMSRGEVYQWFEDHGWTRKDAEMWFMGNDRGKPNA